MKCAINDWVSFYQNGAMVIATVVYRCERVKGWASDREDDEHFLETSAGQVREHHVFERRAAPPTAERP